MKDSVAAVGRTTSDEQIAVWVEQFHRDGYLFRENVLPPDKCADMCADLDRALAENGEENQKGIMEVPPRLFEANLRNRSLF